MDNVIVDQQRNAKRKEKFLLLLAAISLMKQLKKWKLSLWFNKNNSSYVLNSIFYAYWIG